MIYYQWYLLALIDYLTSPDGSRPGRCSCQQRDVCVCVSARLSFCGTHSLTYCGTYCGPRRPPPLKPLAAGCCWLFTPGEGSASGSGSGSGSASGSGSGKG